MEINITVDSEFRRKITGRFLKNIAEAVLKEEKTGENVELGILITGQEKLHELNRDYRGKDNPTDVLSFFMIPEEDDKNVAVFVTPPDRKKHLGEVIISYPQAVIQAKEHNHTVAKEISILLIHGILHLLGYDHEKPADGKTMQTREQNILEKLI